MSTVVEIELDGKKREVTQLDITAQAFGVGTKLVDDLVEKHPFITTNTKYAVKLAGKSHNLLVSAIINLVQDKDKFRAVISTGTGWCAGELVGSATTALATAVAAAAGVAGWYGSEKAKDIYDAIREFFGNGSGQTNDTIVDTNQNTTTITTTKTLEETLQEFNVITELGNQNWDIKASIPSVSNPDDFNERLSYNQDTKQATIQTDDDNLEDYVSRIVEYTNANKLIMNNQTYTITPDTDTLLIRNAIGRDNCYNKYIGFDYDTKEIATNNPFCNYKRIA